MKKKAIGFLIGLFIVQSISASSIWANEWAATDEIEDGRLNAQEEEELEKATEDKTQQGNEDAVKDARIGISIPDSREDVWVEQAKYISQKLENLGYTVDLRFAWGEAEAQISDVKKWIDEGIDLIIVNPVDVNEQGLREQLERTTDLKIPVLCLEQVIKNTKAEDYLVTYDYLGLGHQIGEYIVKKENLEKSDDKKTIEYILGEQENLSAFLFYLGLQEKLQPFIDNEKLVCLSGEDEFIEIALEEEAASEEKTRLKTILKEYYSEKAPDIICTFSDDFASMTIEVLEKEGYGKEKKQTDLIDFSERTLLKTDQEKEELEEAEEVFWPMITGNGATIDGMNAIINGKQAVSAYHNTEKLAETCSKMVDSIIKKDKIENVVEQYDNGVTVIPACVTEMQLVDQDNYEKVLIETGIYTIEQQVAIPE